MSLADYLAKKYLTADAPAEKKSKKRKRKAAAEASNGLVIADDDVTGWNTGPQNQDDEDGPMMGKQQSPLFHKIFTLAGIILPIVQSIAALESSSNPRR